jgi:hypothetical protein
MTCPICRKRKASRFCPAKAESICSVCCGTEREVTIDCPADCVYLVASRRAEEGRRNLEARELPFPDRKIPESFIVDHERVLVGLANAVCVYARERRELVDSDVVAAVTSLAETYQTLSSGVYYEKPPVHPLQRELYESLKAALRGYQQTKAARDLERVSDSELRDVLIFFAKLGVLRMNGRPKSRAFLDFLRTQLASEDYSRPAPSIIVPG